MLSLSVLVALLVNGCSATSTNTLSQEVENVVWLPNESGMVAYVDQVTEDAYGNQSEGQNLYQVNGGGTIGNAMNANSTTPSTGYRNGPIVYVSSDGKTAITQFGSDIFSLPISGGNVNDLIQATALFGVSPDGKYAITTPTPAGYGYIIVYPYLLTSSSPILGTQVTRPSVISNRVLWLNNDDYAMTVLDSVGIDSLVYSHVTIYDASGDLLDTIANGDVSFSAGAFASGTNDLFVRTPAMGIDRINLNTHVRTPVVTNDTVYSMDASADGTVLVYSSSAGSTNGTLPAYAVNLSDMNKKMFASNVIIPRISPQHDHVACVNYQDESDSDIQVYSLITPP